VFGDRRQRQAWYMRSLRRSGDHALAVPVATVRHQRVWHISVAGAIGLAGKAGIRCAGRVAQRGHPVGPLLSRPRGDRRRRQSLLDRDIDDGPVAQRRVVDAGTELRNREAAQQHARSVLI
jgi:hypothetical protein